MSKVQRRQIRRQVVEDGPAEDAVQGVELAPAQSAQVAAREPQHVSKTDAREPAHVLDHAPQRLRTRRRKSTVNEDEFFVPTDEIPEGSTYEWKRVTVNGQEDPFYLARMREQGWEPVDPKKHPNWLPPGYNQPHIIKGGQILMERPKELTEEARKENRQLARQQIREAEQRLGLAPKDTLDRSLVKPRITKEIGRMVPQAIEE